LGHQIGYQVHVKPLVIQPELIKAAGRNLLKIDSIEGVLPAVKHYQNAMFEKLKYSGGIVEEFIGVDTSLAAAWLRQALRRCFISSCSPLQFEYPEFNFIAEAYEESIFTAIHSGTFLDLHIDEICSDFINDDERIEIFGWYPDEDITAKCENQSIREVPIDAISEPVITTPLLANMPAISKESNDYIFVSYQHRDLEKIIPIVNQINKWGYSIWYDASIPGGAEWDAMIEQKIESCRLLIVFVSDSAVSSKYVRREVKYADGIGKSILAVRLEDCQLRFGMKMLLTQYQMIDAATQGYLMQVKMAVEYLVAFD
jgi:hypothetical protein